MLLYFRLFVVRGLLHFIVMAIESGACSFLVVGDWTASFLVSCLFMLLFS